MTTLRLLLVSALLLNTGEVRAQQAEDPAPSEETDTSTDAEPAPSGADEAESDATTPEAPQVQAEPEPAPEAVDTRKKTVPNEPDFPFYKGEHLRFQNADIFKRTGATLIGSVLET